MLLPNERLAIQAHADIARLFPELGAELVTGRTGGSGSETGDTRWLVGTTALLFRDVGHLDAVVVDEQHRFSVEQRRALARDGTHVVELSATPIPRTQALLLYGELDVIRLTVRHTPQDIVTRIVTRAGAKAMVGELRDIVAGGGRLLIVCPRREDDEEEGGDALPSVASVAAKWERLFPGLVRALHGESPADDSDKVFDDLASGSARILVATTVVEVGLNIADLRGLVVVHAERFGISQLHQCARLSEGGQALLSLPAPPGRHRRSGGCRPSRRPAMASNRRADMRIRSATCPRRAKRRAPAPC